MEMALEHGKYLLIKHLNSGGYGAVYEAEDRHLNRRVAIKKTDYIAAPNEPNDQGVPVVVLREGSVLCRLQHPNVVKMHDIYMDHGQYCFVFELCNCNLRECMQELDQAGHHWMEENMLRNYLQQILSGLEYCHERRIIHRDLKPDNILLDHQRVTAKIADFGMARVMQCRGGGKYTEGLVTHWYRPPEIILGDTQYDSAVDMWSLGCIFVEMMMLCPAFACSTEIECLMVIFQRLGTPGEEEWPGVSQLPNFLMEFPKWDSPEFLFEAFPGMSEDSPYFHDEEALDLTNRLLCLDPRNRIRAADCLVQHPFFADLDDEASDEGDEVTESSTL
jgi:serine/threonine protein kinase